ncbi:MAG: SDR family oxidoreductase [gamma proteobacterium symbiont of Taylorina sp.]|nr:SDR family oxidoreductase [gamma proteobacterium symbiont of Taylorina sp.]
MSKILITGSSGFIGQFLADELHKNKHNIVYTYRNSGNKVISTEENAFSIGDINASTQWQFALTDVDIVIHLAARVHVMQETHADPLTVFREVNTLGSMRLAKQAVEAGVKRFIYLSTIKVNGERTSKTPFYADDQPNPREPYAVSKFEAEQQLLALGQKTGLDVVIIRPPLVYGPEVKGNFSRLIKLVDKSIPLPLAGIQNARSLVNIQNLCSLIQVCLSHPKAVGEVFLVSDAHDLSTSELFEKIAQALGKKSRLYYLPGGFLKFLTALAGRRSEYERLFGTLQVDISKNQQLLGWEPDVSVEEGIKKTVNIVD